MTFNKKMETKGRLLNVKNGWQNVPDNCMRVRKYSSVIFLVKIVVYWKIRRFSRGDCDNIVSRKFSGKDALEICVIFTFGI